MPDPARFGDVWDPVDDLFSGLQGGGSSGVGLDQCWRHQCRETVEPDDDLGLCDKHTARMRNW